MTDSREAVVKLHAMGITTWRRRPSGEGRPHAESAPASIWETLRAEVAACQRCPLHETRNHPVFGDGNLSADWLFVGEAPGAEEDRKGLPFVGRAGHLLNEMLFALGLERGSVFICNVLKCRPPDNRDPMGNEVVQCEPYLHRQIDLLSPRVIVAMGRFAAQSLLKSQQSIGRLRGDVHAYGDLSLPLVVTYHPAYLLRSPADKAKTWDDLQLARAVVDGSRS
jgi:uracil-DNA glycosylase family 4